jgi:hypothetical protein
LQRGFDAILTIDYDTVFTAENVKSLMRLMLLHPEADAICAAAIGSRLEFAAADHGSAGRRRPRQGAAVAVRRGPDKLKTGHFGLTLIRTSALRDMPKPWFWGEAGARRLMERRSYRRRHLFLAAVGEGRQDAVQREPRRRRPPRADDQVARPRSQRISPARRRLLERRSAVGSLEMRVEVLQARHPLGHKRVGDIIEDMPAGLGR